MNELWSVIATSVFIIGGNVPPSVIFPVSAVMGNDDGNVDLILRNSFDFEIKVNKLSAFNNFDNSSILRFHSINTGHEETQIRVKNKKIVIID